MDIDNNATSSDGLMRGDGSSGAYQRTKCLGMLSMRTTVVCINVVIVIWWIIDSIAIAKYQVKANNNADQNNDDIYSMFYAEVDSKAQVRMHVIFAAGHIAISGLCLIGAWYEYLYLIVPQVLAFLYGIGHIMWVSADMIEQYTAEWGMDLHPFDMFMSLALSMGVYLAILFPHAMLVWDLYQEKKQKREAEQLQEVEMAENEKRSKSKSKRGSADRV